MTPDAFRAERELPLISCIMPTYGRPQYVHESVKMFLDQDYPAKELVILNDCAGQVFHCELSNVRVFNTSQRYRSLGEKRNECIRKSRGELLAIWDDDGGRDHGKAFRAEVLRISQLGALVQVI